MNEKYQSGESMHMTFDVTTIRQMTDAAKYEKIKNEIYQAARKGEEYYITDSNMLQGEAEELMQYFKAKGFKVEKRVDGDPFGEADVESSFFVRVRISWEK